MSIDTTDGRATRSAPGAAAAPPPRLLSPEYRSLVVGVVGVVVAVAFEAIAVATAMPVAARELGGLQQYGLAFSVFLTTSLLGMVVAGEVSDRRGPVVPFVVAAVTFGVGLVIAGAAPSMLVLVIARAVQGFGAGLNIVSLYVVVGRAFPAELRPRVFSAISSGWVVPSLVGPRWRGCLPTTSRGGGCSSACCHCSSGPGCWSVRTCAASTVRPRACDPSSGVAAGCGCRGCRRRCGGVAVRRPAAGAVGLAGALVVAVALLASASRGCCRPAGCGPARAADRRGPARGDRRGLLRRGVVHPAHARAGARPGDDARGCLAHRRAPGWALGAWLQGRPTLRTPRPVLV